MSDARVALPPPPKRPTRRTSVTAYVEAEGRLQTYQAEVRQSPRIDSDALSAPGRRVKAKVKGMTRVSLKTGRQSRKPKTSRVPRTRAGGEWTEAAFWGWLRSGLRQMSLRWPPRKQVELAARRRYNGTNKRRTWEYLCAACGSWFAGKEIQVDHIEEIGTLKAFSDLPQFCERLFCEKSDLRVLCDNCHLLRRKKNG